MSSSGAAFTDNQNSLIFTNTETAVAEGAIAAFPPQSKTYVKKQLTTI